MELRGMERWEAWSGLEVSANVCIEGEGRDWELMISCSCTQVSLRGSRDGLRSAKQKLTQSFFDSCEAARSIVSSHWIQHGLLALRSAPSTSAPAIRRWVGARRSLLLFLFARWR